MAAVAYNLKKLICLKRLKIAENAIKNSTNRLISTLFNQSFAIFDRFFSILNYKTLYNMLLKNREWELCNEHYNLAPTKISITHNIIKIPTLYYLILN